MSKPLYPHTAKLIKPQLDKLALANKLALGNYATMVGISEEHLQAFADGSALPNAAQIQLLSKTLKINEDKLYAAAMADLARPEENGKPAPPVQASGSRHPTKHW